MESAHLLTIFEIFLGCLPLSYSQSLVPTFFADIACVHRRRIKICAALTGPAVISRVRWWFCMLLLGFSSSFLGSGCSAGCSSCLASSVDILQPSFQSLNKVLKVIPGNAAVKFSIVIKTVNTSATGQRWEDDTLLWAGASKTVLWYWKHTKVQGKRCQMVQ
jgi:hypothetical protein